MCEYIDAGHTCIGYRVNYLDVVRDTPFAHEEELMQPFGYFDHEQCSPLDALRKSWKQFVNAKYLQLIAENVTPHVGCISIIGHKEFSIETKNCVVVFGHKLNGNSLVKVIDGNNESVNIVPIVFPILFPSIVREFIVDFKNENPVDADTSLKKRKKSCNIEANSNVADGIKCELEIVQFMYNEYYDDNGIHDWEENQENEEEEEKGEKE